jgi:hypothetical protein
MTKLFPSIAICLLMVSCSTLQIAYVGTTSSEVKESDERFFFENDTLKVTYAFWENLGVMAFSIENKLNIPIYIDWKKSSFINANIKSDYFIDKEVAESRSASASTAMLYRDVFNWSRWYPFAVSVASGESVKYKAERIMFIPPHSITGKSMYRIMPNDYINMDNAEKKTLGDSNIKGKVLTIERSMARLFFRNFFTYSTKESFENEYYVNNEFYIRKVVELAPKYLDQMAAPNRFYIRTQTYQ